ncbi:MAG TPA: hypothetical protein VF157_08765 [Chloroflexota bacterium]
MRKRVPRAIFAVFVMAIMGVVALPLASAQTPADQDIPGGHFYTEANGGTGPQYGYRITDEGGLGFWSEFKRLGGVNALGYPASRRYAMPGFMAQATQKVILQWRPDVSPPRAYFLNVFDAFHDQGKDSALQQQYGIPPQLDPSFDAGKAPDQVQAARIALLNEDPPIAAFYKASANPALYYGLPTSKLANAGAFNIVRLQRVAIQHWNQAGPGGIGAGDVTVVNGGDVAKVFALVPPDAQITETASGQPNPSATPAATLANDYHSKHVTEPPVDCNGDPTISAIPCLASAPNGATQYIKGRVMDQKGNHLQFVLVQATILGTSCTNTAGVYSNPCVITHQTAQDGTFTFFIAGGPPSGEGAISPCPPYSLTYQIMIVDRNGLQDSDVYTVTYGGNCFQAGEFHFDFVKVR